MKPRFAFLVVLPLVFLIIAGRQSSAAGTAPEAGIPPRRLPVWRSEVAALGVVLWLARRGAAGWTNQSIANTTFFNGESLALDAADRPHVAYTNFDKDLVYAVLGSGGWERTTIPMVGHGGSDNTLLLDETGAAHISTIQDGLHLYYATNRGGAWVTMPVTLVDPVGEKHALALDTDNRPYLLYYHRSAGQLRWAAKEGDAWATSIVADVAPTGLEIAMAIGPDGVPQMAYVDAAQNQVITGLCQAGHWSLAPLTTAATACAKLWARTTGRT